MGSGGWCGGREGAGGAGVLERKWHRGEVWCCCFTMDIGTYPGNPAALNTVSPAMLLSCCSSLAAPPLPPQTPHTSTLTPGYRQPLVYNWQTFTSLVRQVYQAERLAPPLQLSQWASAYANIWSAASSPAWWRQAAASGQWAKVAVAVSAPLLSAEHHARGVLTPGRRGVRHLQDWRDYRPPSPCWVQDRAPPLEYCRGALVVEGFGRSMHFCTGGPAGSRLPRSGWLLLLLL